MNGGGYQTEEVTTAKREVFYPDGQYRESVHGRGNSSLFQVMQQASPFTLFCLFKGIFSLLFTKIV